MSLTVKQEKYIPTSVENVLSEFLDHDNLSQFFNAKFRVVKLADEKERDGGKGSIREVSISGVTFQEEIVNANAKEIEYRVLGSFPVREHRGTISFESHQNSTFVSYKIRCKTNWYLPRFILEPLLNKDLKKCLAILESKYAIC